MGNKRGLSQVVTTIILILLILVAIGGIWAVINTFIIKGSSQININQLTIDLKIKSAKINYTTGIAEVRVIRGVGEGELKSIKFIVEDPRNSEVFDEPAENFLELAERTFDLDLKSRPNINIYDVSKISIAPVYFIGSTGESSLGRITDTMDGLDDYEGSGNQDVPEETTNPVCTQDLDCGAPEWVEGSEVCNSVNTAVMQYKKTPDCVLGFCVTSVEQEIKESCPSGTTCYNAACIMDEISCTQETVETDCGISGWVGVQGCSSDQKSIIQDWQDFSCSNSICSSTTQVKTKQNCEGEELCYNGECFIPLECTQNSDCSPGEVCRDGECVLEEVIVSGTVRSVWPFGVAEYFDSPDLPLEKSPYENFNIIFPGSLQNGCLRVSLFKEPDFDGGISYIKLNQTKTNVTDGDSFQIWETDYICSII